jgi:transposase
LSRQYKTKISDFKAWRYKTHAKEYLIYPNNVSEQLSIDETAFTNGELYTIVTNKQAKGKKGCIVAIVKGVKVDQVTRCLKLIPKIQRDKVQEITLDLAHTMVNICKNVFPKAEQVTDRFHVQKLANEAVQNIRIKYRWEALDQENKLFEKAKKDRRTYTPLILTNGDTVKQLLARSRYLLFKHYSKWTDKQKERAAILFEKYPEIEESYDLSMRLFSIYQNTQDKGVGFTKLAQWYNTVEKSGSKNFNTVTRTIQQHYRSILNYFDNRSTNASAESFNAKIKAFRTQFRGVRDVNYFLFRLEKIFA